jgi:hypothetical protein
MVHSRKNRTEPRHELRGFGAGCTQDVHDHDGATPALPVDRNLLLGAGKPINDEPASTKQHNTQHNTTRRAFRRTE